MRCLLYLRCSDLTRGDGGNPHRTRNPAPCPHSVLRPICGLHSQVVARLSFLLPQEYREILLFHPRHHSPTLSPSSITPQSLRSGSRTVHYLHACLVQIVSHPKRTFGRLVNDTRKRVFVEAATALIGMEHFHVSTKHAYRVSVTVQ